MNPVPSNEKIGASIAECGTDVHFKTTKQPAPSNKQIGVSIAEDGTAVHFETNKQDNL